MKRNNVGVVVLHRHFVSAVVWWHDKFSEKFGNLAVFTETIFNIVTGTDLRETNNIPCLSSPVFSGGSEIFLMHDRYNNMVGRLCAH